MARVFVQPNEDGTFSTVYENDGNFEPIFRGDQALAEQNANVVGETRLGWLPPQGAQASRVQPQVTAQGYTVGGGSEFLRPAVDAASAAAQQAYLRDRLNRLEIPMSVAEREQLIAKMTGYYTPAGGNAAMSDDDALDYIWKARPDLAGFYRANGWGVDTPDGRRRATRNWLESVDPSRRGKTPQQVATELGAPSAGAAGGSLPTFEREQWLANEAARQKQLEAGQRQFYTGALLSKSGPRDYGLYQALQTPAAFAEMRGSPSWEQAAVDFWRSGRSEPSAQEWQGWWRPQAGGGQTTGFAQPKDVTPQEWSGWSPSRREMELGRVSAAGIDLNDWERQRRAAAPTGQAAPNTWWRG